MDCKGESICSLLLKNFGTDADFYLKGIITNSLMQLRASLKGQIKMTEDMHIKDVNLLVSVGKQNQVSITGIMKIKLDNKDFDFQGRVILHFFYYGLIMFPICKCLTFYTRNSHKAKSVTKGTSIN